MSFTYCLLSSDEMVCSVILHACPCNNAEKMFALAVIFHGCCCNCASVMIPLAIITCMHVLLGWANKWLCLMVWNLTVLVDVFGTNNCNISFKYFWFDVIREWQSLLTPHFSSISLLHHLYVTCELCHHCRGYLSISYAYTLLDWNWGV